jgi:hypothetical protein
MKLKWASKIAALSLGTIICALNPLSGMAQDQATQTEAAPSTQVQNQQDQDQAPQESVVREMWSWAKEGKISINARYRIEGFERDGAPFTGTAYAPTLRLALGYETPAYHGFSVFAQGEAVIVTGPADYSVPLLPSQNRPNLPAILDPKSLELNQGYLKWVHGATDQNNVSVTVGRQEIGLNDGRFLSFSNWRQVHGSFDAARMDVDLPWNFSFTYAYINRFYREDGYNATDGEEPMHSHMFNVKWTKPTRINLSLYGLLLDFRGPAQFATSTETYGLRLTGPYQFNPQWSLWYTAEFAKQMNYGTNPNREDENYYLGEIGPGCRDFSLKGSVAFLGGRSATDLLTTPLAPPRNGWTDLFFNDPNIPAGHGLEAFYVTASGPLRFLGGAVATLIYYDYYSDSPRIHYGTELDSSMAYKVKKVSNRWEIGYRVGHYWSDRLLTNALRASIYTSFTM